MSATTRTSEGSDRPANSRRVGFLLAATGVSSVGDGAFLSAAPLLAAVLTRSPVAVAVVAVAESLPWFVVGPVAGALVDRWRRRATMMAADLIRAVALLGLVVLLLSHNASVASLATVAFIMTTGRCFFDSAAQAIVPYVVGRGDEELTKVNGRLYALDTAGATLAGPPLGSLAFAAASWAPFTLDAVSFGASAALVSRLPDQAVPSTARSERLLKAMATGMRFLIGEKSLRALAVGLALYNFAWNLAMATFVLFALRDLALASVGYGLLLAAGAAGAIAAGFLAPPFVRRAGAGRAVGLSLALQGVAWLALAAVSTVWLAAVVLAVVGATSTTSTVAVVSARQALSPNELLGRVVSAFRVLGNGSGTLGALCGGLIATGLGVRAPLWTAGSACILALVAYVALLRAKRRPVTRHR